MASVFFKRGTLNSLNSQPINNGTIYITTDERAMYVDIGDNQRIRLGDFVECADWAAVTAIENPNPHSLYYANSQNILAKWDATNQRWAQVNGNVAIDNLIAYLNQEASTTNNTTTLTTHLLDTNANEVYGSTIYTSNDNDLLSITGGSQVIGNSSRTNATITLTPANLKESASLVANTITNGVSIATVNKQTGTTATGTTVNTSVTDDNPINLVSTGGLTIVKNASNGNIEFFSEGAYTQLRQSLNANGQLSILLMNSLGDSVSQTAQVTPTITYGHTDTIDAVFANGTAVLDVYTTSQIDTLIGNELKALDAMTFKGTLGTDGTIQALPTEHVKNGDTYKVISAASYNGENCRIGDMFIASGTEDTNGELSTPITWAYIPSGNDGSNDFSFVYDNAGQIRFCDNNGSLTTFTAGTNITFSGTNSAITVAHEAITRTDDTGSAVVQSDASSLTFNAVTSIESSNGHVTRVVTTPITVKDTHNVISSFSANKASSTTGGVTGVTTTYTLVDESGGNSATDTIQSSSLDLSVTDNKTVIDLVWGTF